MVILLSWQLTPGMEPKWYFTPCLSNIKNNLVHKMLLKILDTLSINVTTLHLFG